MRVLSGNLDRVQNNILVVVDHDIRMDAKEEVDTS